MGKNKGKGGKGHRKGRRNRDQTERKELQLKTDGQEYAIVTQMLGNGRLRAKCIGGKVVTCRIRGTMRTTSPNNWINQCDLILIGTRDYQPSKADVILKYTSDEHARLIELGEVPKTDDTNSDMLHNDKEQDIGFDFGEI
jgi:translation initiation factor 1A